MTIENDVFYILTVRDNVIIRYVKVMPTLHLFFLCFKRISVHFQLWGEKCHYNYIHRQHKVDFPNTGLKKKYENCSFCPGRKAVTN